jgi:hypothetical protein
MASILAITTAEADARLVGITGQAQDAGFKVTRSWPWIAGVTSTGTGDVKTLVAALNTVLTYTDPKANGVTYTGKFVNSDTSAKDENVDGNESRATSIVQVLTKVKVPTDVAGLGTPDIGADKETLNYLGFQEGTQEHIYHKYRNLDPSTITVVMGLTPTSTGYTIVKREFNIETDKTATLLVVFEKDTWTAKVWANDKKVVSYINYDTTNNTGIGNQGGKGYEVQTQLTGINQSEYPARVVDAQAGDANRVVQNVTLVQRRNGEYEIGQRQGISFSGTADADAFIAGAKSSMYGAQSPGLTRVWPRRTYAAMITLTTTTGKACNNYSTYIHNSFYVDDHGDGTFTVTQTLGSTETGGTVQPTYFAEVNIQTVKTFSRTKDNKNKYIIYQKWLKCFSSEAAGLAYIKDILTTKYPSTPSAYVVKGSDRVTKKDFAYYVAQVVVGATQTEAWPPATTAVIGEADWV